MEISEIERKAILLSIEEAKKSKHEDTRVHPLVGVAIVSNEEILASAHRGEIEPGNHAEFTISEKKLENDSLAGCTVFTTLEPCTTRNHPKIPCVERLIERKVGVVWIGMVDPNSKITGKGIERLREANIEVQLYPSEYKAIIEELNRDFIRANKKQFIQDSIDSETIEKLSKKTLDEWYSTINKIYWNRNYYQAESQTFSHLVEVIGGLSLLASEKKKENIKPENYMPKAIAWWLALCGKLGINSVEEMLWDKFPVVCPYCQKNPHVDRICKEIKQNSKGPDWETLKTLGKNKNKPKTIGDWQLMFEEIYPVTSTDDYKPVFARLVEELGELAEAIRVFPAEPGYFLSEACDVFAWLMKIQNIFDNKQSNNFGEALNKEMAVNYPEICLDCNQNVCSCPPILKSTIGRIAHEVPIPKNSTERIERFLSADQTSEKFGNI
jgi:pyrimidine deaminase RibD-like protein/NTP pyrophosphatase (non-canonical NTP hydrolase)